ncbi:cellulose binding domain-containing protein [Actinosynnema sp. NPDC023794]
MEHPRRHRVAHAVSAALLVAAGMVTVLNADPDPARALENGVARTPPMGWNSWNTFGCNINETLIRQMTDAMVNSGMRDAGYEYVVVDDCWMNPNRDSAGNLQGDPGRFPSGMKALGDYIHGKGLKFGIYQAPLTETCAQYFNSYPGSTGALGHEEQDARQFAAWGVDFLKYDWCSPSGTMDDQVRAFAKMRDALRATGRPIVYSINSNSIHDKTGPRRNWGDVANMWRTTEDITNKWDTGQTNGYPMGVQNIVNVTVPLASYAKPGGFNDPDMMEVGRGGMNDTEMRSHFALWAIMASPLIAGNDLRNMDAATQTILKNANLIGINQDPLGLQAVQISNDGTRRVLAKRLSTGEVAVALFNQGSTPTTISTAGYMIGLEGVSITLRDAWTNAISGGSDGISATVPAHGTVVYLAKGSGMPTTTTTTITTTTTPQPGGSCRVTNTVNAWGNGLTSDITITNTGSAPVSGWSLAFTLPGGQNITSGWNASYSPSSGQVTARNVSYNGSIAPGASVAIGFQATHTGDAAKPASYTLNGAACTT